MNEQIPQKKSVILLWFLSFITAGIYAGIWYIKQSKEFDSLETTKKLSRKVGVIILSIVIIHLIFVTLTILKIINELISSILLIVIGLALFIFYLFGAFRSRTILNEIWAKKGVPRKVSWLFTLFFNFLYIQYEINRTIENKENEKRVGPWIFFIVIIIIMILVPVLIGILWVVLMKVIQEENTNLIGQIPT